MCGCFSRGSPWGPGLKPRHVPWLGIELATLWFAGLRLIHWATPARATCNFIVAYLITCDFYRINTLSWPSLTTNFNPYHSPSLLHTSHVCLSVPQTCRPILTLWRLPHPLCLERFPSCRHSPGFCSGFTHFLEQPLPNALFQVSPPLPNSLSYVFLSYLKKETTLLR